MLTSVLESPTNWLLTLFISSALKQYGTVPGQNAAQHVVLVSIWRSYDLWSELLKKAVSSKVSLVTDTISEFMARVSVSSIALIRVN